MISRPYLHDRLYCRYATDIIADDPEFAHHKALRQPLKSLSDSAALKRRVRFSSLSWTHRQLVRCTKETIDDRVSHLSISEHQSGSSLKSPKRPVPLDHDSQQHHTVLHPSDFQHRPSTKLILDRFSLIDALIAAYEADNAEAEEILLDMVTPPSFEEKLCCHSCERAFSITLFRHHCRHCGK